MTEAWTIQRLLLWTRDWLGQKGVQSPRVDAELMLGHVLGLRRLDLLLRFDQSVSPEELARFKAMIQRRARSEPVAYILGTKGFYSIDVLVTPAVLVPRPETEVLVDRLLAFLKSPEAPEGPVLDLCTGSGAIVLAAAHELRTPPKPQRKPNLDLDAPPSVPQVQAQAPLAWTRAFWATDLSDEALTVARKNADVLGIPVAFLQGDLFAPLPAGQRFAAIVTNPPYIRSDVMPTLPRDVLGFEPYLALDGGPQGMVVLARIAEQAAHFLLPGGLLAIELGSRDQGAAVVALLADHGLPGASVEQIQSGPTCAVLVNKSL